MGRFTMAQILLVEDDNTARDYLRNVMTRVGHTVIEAPDLQSGLDSYRTHSPDLALVDLSLSQNQGVLLINSFNRTTLKRALSRCLGVQAMRVTWGPLSECGRSACSCELRPTRSLRPPGGGHRRSHGFPRQTYQIEYENPSNRQLD